MMRVRRRLSAALVLITAAAALTAAPNLATGVPDRAHPAACGGAADSASPEVADLARDLRLPAAEAARRIGWQLSAEVLTERARSAGDAFGGVWIDPSTGRVKLGQTTVSSASVALLDDCGLGDGADLVAVTNPASSLEAAASWLGSRLAAAGGPGMGAGIDYSRNRVVLDVPADRTLTTAERSLIGTATKRYAGLLVTAPVRGAAAPAACNSGNYCDPPLRGGIRISSSAGSGCTLGFLARSRSDNKLYGVTAGHCGGGTWSTRFSNNSAHVIGPRHSGHFGANGDAELITVNNPAGWNARAWVLVEASADTARDESYNIAAVGSSTVGMRICKSGYAGNTDCGVVTRLGVSVDYGSTVVNGLGEANFCVIPGDSGGPNYASHRAYGLTSGYVPNASPCRSFYQGAAGAANLLNVNISTEG
jgi:streptogrisin C